MIELVSDTTTLLTKTYASVKHPAINRRMSIEDSEYIDENFVEHLGITIQKACALRGLTLAKACSISGIKYSTLHSQIKKNREIPFSTIDKFSAALNLPIGYFSQTKPSLYIEPNDSLQNANNESTNLQAEAAKALTDLMGKQVAAMADWGFRIGIDDVLDWLHAHNNTLINHEWLLDRIDLFYPAGPEDTMIRPYKIGKKSLAARYFRLLKTNDYANVVGSFDKSLLSEVISTHISAASQKYLITDKTIDQPIDGARVKGTYRRLIAPVKAVDGTKYTLVFSKLTQFTGRQ